MQIIVSRLNDILLAQVGGQYTSLAREDEAQSLRIIKRKLEKKRLLGAEKIGWINEQGLHKINGGLLILPAFPHVSLNSRKNTKIETYI